ncbi:MAG: type III-A CRISPR-associated protein Csm2 [Dorea sp.]|jgi:CRISPR-associated protein Csm2|nr:type III-A CRISPR-associated protein Csm2 [Dorea sp.]
MILTEDNYVDRAESAIKRLQKMKDKKDRYIPIVTTSKIRNLLAMTAGIYNDVLNIKGERLPQDITGRIQYLKVRFVYEAGREQGVKNLVEKAEILECLDGIGGSRQNYILFSRYMEALVAFRKFIGGRDD